MKITTTYTDEEIAIAKKMVKYLEMMGWDFSLPHSKNKDLVHDIINSCPDVVAQDCFAIYEDYTLKDYQRWVDNINEIWSPEELAWDPEEDCFDLLAAHRIAIAEVKETARLAHQSKKKNKK